MNLGKKKERTQIRYTIEEKKAKGTTVEAPKKKRHMPNRKPGTTRRLLKEKKGGKGHIALRRERWEGWISPWEKGGDGRWPTGKVDKKALILIESDEKDKKKRHLNPTHHKKKKREKRKGLVL